MDKAREIQQKDELIQEKNQEIEQLLASSQDSEQVASTLQHIVEQKDATLQAKDTALQAKDELLQEKERQIQELHQRMRKREGNGMVRGHEQNEHLQRQLQQLIQRKDREIEQLQRQLQASSRDNEQVVSALQQSVEQKDAALQAKDELLQDKEREIQELQQWMRKRKGSGVASDPLKLEWKDGPRAPFETYGESVAVNGGIIYCYDFNNNKILMFNSGTGQWTVLLKCPKIYFSIAIVNGQLTAIGGSQSGRGTKTLLSLQHNQLDISQQKWTEQFPAMTYSHNGPAVATTNTSLIVAGGFGPDKEKAPVEVMDTQTSYCLLVHSSQPTSSSPCSNSNHL